MDFAKNKTQSTRKWQDSAAIISFGSVRQWAESLTEEDIMELHVRDLPHSEDKKKDSQARDLLPPEPDPYKRANKLARLAGSMLPPRGVELRNPMPPINTALAKCEKRVEEFLAKGLCQGGESDFVGEAIDRHHAKRIDPKAQQIDPDTTQTINLKIGNWWIVDAVDGRENMTAARPEVAVSIAYYKNSIAKLALIHLPYRGLTVATTFPIHKLLVNGVEWARRRAPAHHLAGAVLALPGDIGRLRETDLDSVMRGLVSKSNAIRVTGALAYDLACMALGEIDARISTSAELVDIAAGVPLVKATGGKVTNLQGQELDLLSGDKCEILAAATHELHAEILKEINLARPAAATS
jgi:fructose-1,6-bisphosphatase/inositol monophosphatase family enzyme